MKKVMAIALAICLLCGILLTGCTGKTEQTNKELTVYIGNQCTDMLELAVSIFQYTYPDVEVHIIDGRTSTDDERKNESERMATELMAGEGADVFILQNRWDIEKMVDRKVFADLSPFFDGDEYFQGDNWVQQIFEGGCRGEYRYAIPAEYGIPVLITSEEAMAESGIDRNKLTDFNGLMDETLKYMEREDARSLFRFVQVPLQCLLWTGYPVIDWETQTVNLKNEQMERFFKWYYIVEQQMKEDNLASHYADAVGIRDGELLFGNLGWGGSFDTVQVECQLINSYDKPVMIPIRNVNGGVSAYSVVSLSVRANSENILNAYRFIQIYMGTQVQTSITCRSQGAFKVNREAQEHIYGIVKTLVFGQEREGFPADCPPFSEEEYKELMSFVDEIDIVEGCNPQWLDMIGELMTPYINGECTYEEAIAQAAYELEIYASE